MPIQKERAINNTFQIIENLKSQEIKRSFYYPFKRLRPPPRAQLPGRIKIFTEEEIFFYSIKRYRQSLQKGELL